MVIVQPLSSWVVVIVRPFASVADETARAVPPLLAAEDDDTDTEELEERLEAEVASAFPPWRSALLLVRLP